MITKIGKYQHLESGSVVAHTADKILLTVEDLQLQIEFVESAAIKETKIEASGGGKSLQLKFINFNLGMGHANTVPLPLGTLNGRKLYMNYCVYGFGTPSIAKLVHYTFMLDING